MSFQDLEAGSRFQQPNRFTGGRQQRPPSRGDPSQEVAAGIFRISTALNSFFRLVNSIGTPKDTLDLRDKLQKTRLQISELVKNTSAKLKEASEADLHGAASPIKKIADAKLAKDFQAVLKEFQKAQRLAAEREITYTPVVTIDIPTRQKTRLQISELVKNTSAKLKEASEADLHGAASPIKKIADAKLAKDFQAVLKEFQKAQRLAAEREITYTPVVTIDIPTSYNAQELDTESLRTSQQQTLLLQSRRQEVVFLDNEITFNEAIIEEREQGIREIQEQIGEVNEIFKDLAVLVNDQGVMIDDISSNIDNSQAATSQATAQLRKAAKTQRANSSLTCLLILIFGIVLLIVIIVVLILYTPFVFPMQKTRLQISELVKNTSAKLKEASEADLHGAASPIKKIADAKLAKDFQAVLKEFQKAQRLAAEREITYTPVVTIDIPTSYNAQELDTESLRTSQQQTLLLQSRRQEVVFLDNEITFNEAIIEEREQGIREIQEQIGEVNEIFKDLAVLVNDQGVMIDDISSNIDNSQAATAQATAQLRKAAKTQRANSSLTCLLILIFGIVLLIVIIVVLV
ncbi:hypothetical protein F2Q70_00007523 [Brassica cretica]|uniref:t-SNARE coiled-coil homology domain-containing protein n=1 Tax=Brassica cretica TaxID=69181 RepID=A0A8S9LVU6_BRACR|nr:hypothetical protein F2Q70_00007523 [Brassica cretica]